jgi:predicted RNA methylase
MNILRVARRTLRQINVEGFGTTTRSLLTRMQVRWNEWRYGIQTDSVIELSELGFQNKEYRTYLPTEYRAFHKMIRALAIDPRQHVFLDFGAGMGRAMILAAIYPFRRVLGVEVAAELVEIATSNIERCRSKLNCQDIDIALCDAANYRIPPDVSVFYLHNPFYGTVLAAVLRNMRAVAMASRSSLLVVCNVPAKSAFED